MKKLGILFATVIMIMLFVLSGSAKDSVYKVGDIIQFGTYPQTEVKDEALIAELNALAPEWDRWTSYGYYSGTDDYGSMVQGDWMRYVDIKHDGNKYRGVKFTQYRPYGTYFTSSDTHQDSNGYSTNTVYWFIFEPIDWRVLDPATGLVMCETIIDSQPYSNTSYHNIRVGGCFNDSSYKNYASDYETSSIRKWLNNDFYNSAFTNTEKKEINTTTLNNDGYYTSIGRTGYEMLDSNPTNDKIFLLSYNEVRNSNFGFNSSSLAYDPARFAQGSDYAQSQGLYVCRSPDSTGDGILDSTYNNNSSWLLRSPGRSSDDCCSVDYYGDSSNVHLPDVYVSYSGVRPALRFNRISGISQSEHKHSYAPTTTQEATCWREGVKTYTCSCGDTYTEAIAKLEHEYRPWETKKKPTCTEPGLEWSYCLICDNDFEREIPAEGHNEYAYTRRATPAEAGAYVVACDKCWIEFSSVSFGRPAEYKLSTTTYTYNGKAKTPKLTVTTSDGKVLKKGVDYTVELPKDRTSVGTHTYRVVFMGDYLGETKVSYQILPGKTSSVSASQSTDYIKLSWKKVSGATGYRVYQYNSSTGKYKTLKTLTGTSYTVKNLKAGTTYKFAVKAYTKADGETLWAASSKTLTTATKPATPTVKATAGSGKATLSWNKISGATGYVVYMMDEFGDYVKVGSTKKTSYTVTDLDYGKTYNFRVKAYKTAGDKNVYSGHKTVKVTTLYPAVYVTPSGKRYHYDRECAGKNATKTTLANAKKTKTPCKTCVL